MKDLYIIMDNSCVILEDAFIGIFNLDTTLTYIHKQIKKELKDNLESNYQYSIDDLENELINLDYGESITLVMPNEYTIDIIKLPYFENIEELEEVDDEVY